MHYEEFQCFHISSLYAFLCPSYNANCIPNNWQNAYLWHGFPTELAFQHLSYFSFFDDTQILQFSSPPHRGYHVTVEYQRYLQLVYISAICLDDRSTPLVIATASFFTTIRPHFSNLKDHNVLAVDSSQMDERVNASFIFLLFLTCYHLYIEKMTDGNPALEFVFLSISGDCLTEKIQTYAKPQRRKYVNLIFAALDSHLFKLVRVDFKCRFP